MSNANRSMETEAREGDIMRRVEHHMGTQYDRRAKKRKKGE